MDTQTTENISSVINKAISNDAISDELLRDIASRINEGAITLDEIKKLFTKPVVSKVEKLPLPAVITETERLALKKLPEVFGSVVPDVRRKLTMFELREIFEERQTIATIAKLITARNDDIRTSVLNHFDVKNEEEGREGPLDKDGHIIVDSSEPIPDTRQMFTWEPRLGSPVISVKVLEQMSEDPSSDFSRADYLALTSVPAPSRVFDETKAMKALKENPKLLNALVKALVPPNPTGSLNVRNRK